ncbi:hypothetical protein F5Y01DRAFT_317389 [Xylaria sp. FL0043]|nr:hypothetical protein F5Y01DRAFT_317389 [Xylaria sp. FL0043]
MVSTRLSSDLQHSPPDTRWGYYVYRTTYEDQDLWERFIEYVKNAVMSSLQPSYDNTSESEVLRYQTLRESFRLVIRENINWNNLTLWEMREIFDPPGSAGADQPEPIKWLTCGMDRWYFTYVNKKILMNFKAIDCSRQTPTPNYFDEGIAVIVVHTQPEWRQYDEDDAGKEWQYVCVYWLSHFYGLIYRDSEGWFTLFVKPPRKWDGY